MTVTNSIGLCDRVAGRLIFVGGVVVAVGIRRQPRHRLHLAGVGVVARDV